MEKTVSIKSILVVLWACIVAGAAVASENHRLCAENVDTRVERLHEYLQLHEEEVAVLIVASVDVTN